MKKLNSYIFITFQKEGVHYFPRAQESNFSTGDWDDVSFLSVPHRHIFHFRVDIEVKHDDREIEFLQFKRWLERLYADNTLQASNKSCEMLADDLAVLISSKYPNRKMKIEVSEDGENGCVNEYN
jgi:hypothetical protein